MSDDSEKNSQQSSRFLFGLLDNKNKKFVQNFVAIISIIILFVYGISHLQKGNITDKDLINFLVMAIIGLGLTLLVGSRENNFARIVIYFLAFLIALPLLIKFWENTTGIIIIPKNNDTTVSIKPKDTVIYAKPLYTITEKSHKETDISVLRKNLIKDGEKMILFINKNNSNPSDKIFADWKDNCRKFLKGNKTYNDTIFNLSEKHVLYNNKYKQIEKILFLIK